jgi:hypothetical protein
LKIPSPKPASFATRSAIFCTAIAVSGVFEEGFQTTGSPHTAAIAAFHAQTATGKLNAVMTPDRPERVPLLVHAVQRSLAVHREAVELAREADGEVADVDHLLHLAEPLGEDLPHLERDEPSERLLVRRSSSPRRRTTRRGRGAGPCASGERLLRLADDRRRSRPRRLPHLRDGSPSPG